MNKTDPVSLRDAQSDVPSAVVIGGGLAGMTAALALAERGVKVTLLEAQRRLGGRIAPIDDLAAGEPIDFCPHAAMGCCTNLAHLLRRIGAADRWQRFDSLHFFGPDGRPCKFAPSRLLPAPLHLLPALLGLRYLGLADRWAIARAVWRLASAGGGCPPPTADAQCLPADDTAQQPTIARWLMAQGQSPEAILLFWAVMLHSALGERLDKIAVQAARKVFLDGFLTARQAWQVYTPTGSLWQALCQPLADGLQRLGVDVRCGSRAIRILGEGHRAEAVELAHGSRLHAQFVILAAAWHQAAGLLAEPLRAAMPQLALWTDVPGCPIAAVHLWFDRPITTVPSAVLTSQGGWWLFAKGRWELAEPCDPTTPKPPSAAETAGRQLTVQGGPTACGTRQAHYYQVVISAAYDFAPRTAEEMRTTVLEVLKRVFPAASQAELLHWRALIHRRAVFCCRPGIEALRLPPRTPIANLFLAGDWTSTGWPATMESAVRSGYAAAEALLAALGQPEPIVVGDLPRAPLVRWMLGGPGNKTAAR